MTPELGLIEGFFGRPWSLGRRAPRRSASSRPHGYRFYLYAPKADAFLRRRWQEPHPEAELAELAALRDVCRAEGVRFGIGLSPFELHLHPDRGWQDRLAAKLAELAPLKPDDLAILFDDMRGDVPDLAERQAAIVHFAAERGVADRIFCCPSYYSDDPILDVAFGARPPFYLEQLGRLLDPADPDLLDRRGSRARANSPPAISPASPGSCAASRSSGTIIRSMTAPAWRSISICAPSPAGPPRSPARSPATASTRPRSRC